MPLVPLTALLWWPTVDQVAALVRARTRTNEGDGLSGGFEGTFTDDGTTTPTASEVLQFIATAAGEMAGEMNGRTPCNEHLQRTAATATAYRAAQLVEISLSPETASAQDSAASAFGRLADRLIPAAGAQITRFCPLDPGVDDPDAVGAALGPAARVPTFDRDPVDDLPVPAMLGRRRPAPLHSGPAHNPRRT